MAVWVYALYSDTPGNYTGKTGEEIRREWLYHLGVPVEEIDELAATGAKAVPVMMPYVTAFFMPRAAGDRPDVVPEGAKNFAFIGQFADSAQCDCIFTTEYSVRTPNGGRLHAYGHRARGPAKGKPPVSFSAAGAWQRRVTGVLSCTRRARMRPEASSTARSSIGPCPPG